MKKKKIGAQTVRLQRFTKTGNESGMVKRIRLTDDGELEKDSSSCWLSDGEAETFEPSISDFASIIDHCDQDQAFCFSNIRLDGQQVIKSQRKATNGELTRTGDNFGWTDGPAALLFDIDGFDGSVDDVIQAIDKFSPGFTDAAKIIASSTSAGISNTETGEALTENMNSHLVVFIENAADLPVPKTIRDNLLARAWLAGHGSTQISKCGALLTRCIIDLAVLSPERLVFRGAPELDDALKREVEPAQFADGDWLDISPMIEPLSSHDETRYNSMVATAKAEKKDEADAVKTGYMKEQISSLVSDGLTRSQAKQHIESRLKGVLLSNDILHFDEFTSTVTVETVLADPEQYEHMTLSDPLEPDYGGTPGILTQNKAILYWDSITDVVSIFSHAHGGQTFYLKRDRDSTLAVLKSLKDSGADNTAILDLWKEMRPHVAADAADIEQIFQWFKKEKVAAIGALRELEKELISGVSDSRVDDPGVHVSIKVLDEQFTGGLDLIRSPDGSFWQYDETHWSRVTDDSIRRAILPHAKQLSEETSGKFSTTRTMNDAFAVICAQQASSSSMVALSDDNPPPVINLQNGELWLTDEGPDLRPHNRDTMALYTGPTNYDPDAQCPAYDEILGLIFAGDECQEKKLHLFEIQGYSIQPNRFLKVNPLFHGDGNNAKTPIAETPQRILGNDIVAELRLDKLESDRWATGSLVGKLIAIEDDMKHGSFWPDSVMKKLSEEKLLRAEYKGKDLFQFRNRAVPYVLSNSVPYFKEVTPAVRERLQVIHFKHAFKNPNKCDDGDPYSQNNSRRLFTQAFSDELPGILNKLVAGYYRVKERGCFDPPKACLIARDDALREGNTLLWYLDEEYEITDTMTNILLSEMMSNYQLWCDANAGRHTARHTSRTFAARLRDAGYTVKESHGQTKVFGLKKKEVGYTSSIPVTTESIGREELLLQLKRSELDAAELQLQLHTGAQPEGAGR